MAQIVAKKTLAQNVTPSQTADVRPAFILDDLEGGDLFYPESDGEPMAETDFQREPLTYAVSSLRLYFQERADVYVSGNLFIYYEEGNPAAVVAPDVFVVLGVSNHDRRIYKVWVEGKVPDVVIEITSKETYKEDEQKKLALYQRLGVKEYFQYDPTGDYLEPPLKGRWLDENGAYQPMRLSRLPDGVLSLYSYLLNLELHLLEAERLRFFDPDAEAYLLSHEEEQQARLEAEWQANLEKRARQAAEARANEAQQQAKLAQHQANLEKRARQTAETRANEAQQQAQLAQQQANLEKRARQIAEAQLEQLKAELERLRIHPKQEPPVLGEE
jgi:Uma2 family endonuclease